MRTWVTVLLMMIFVTCSSCLTEKELEVLRTAIASRPNQLVNDLQASKFEVAEERAGLLTLRTNTRPGYIDPAKAGYPLERDFEFNVHKYPMYGTNATCVPTNDPLGITIYGTLIYSVSLNKPGCPQADERKVRDGNKPGGAVRTDFDECGGHVALTDKLYRVYTWSSCLQNLTCSISSQIIGVAFDGYPIYGPIDETGRQLTTVDLDECHGKVSSDGSYRYHATIDYPYFVSCYKGIVHEDVGIKYPIQCTCPHYDTPYIEPHFIPFPNYTIAYEWVPIFRNLSLFPCHVCTSVRKHNDNTKSWLNVNYQESKKKITVCNMTTEYRFAEVIKRRLSQGRLPPDKEYDYFYNLENPDKSSNRGKLSPSSSSTVRLSINNVACQVTLSALWLYLIFIYR